MSALLAGGLLVALSIPALGMQFKNPGFDGYSRSQPVIQTHDRLQAAFPGGAVPATTVIKADDVTAAPVQAAIQQLHDRALATGQLSEPSRVEISPDKTVAVVALSVKGSGTDAASERSLEALRSEVVPATVGRLPGAQVAVTGVTAGSKDFNDAMIAHAPIVFAFVLSLAFILLLVTFRSIVVPIKAIVLNLLSAGAAYGILVLVFQDGHGEKLLDFQSVGGIAPVIPLFLFVILFGLSMDYHVFILSRVREAVNRGMSNDDAVAHGLKSTAGVVTSAALVMVAVFGSFALGSDQLAKQIGVGLAAAILIDATIIRAVLLPATHEAPRRAQLVPAQAPRLAAEARSRAADRRGLTHLQTSHGPTRSTISPCSNGWGGLRPAGVSRSSPCGRCSPWSAASSAAGCTTARRPWTTRAANPRACRSASTSSTRRASWSSRSSPGRTSSPGRSSRAPPRPCTRSARSRAWPRSATPTPPAA